MRKVIDAEFEVVSGPMPVRWQKRRRKPVDGLSVLRWSFAGFMALVALYTLVLGLAGAKLDTRDDVEAWKSRQPVPAALTPEES